jgi:D-aminopeptidase
MKNPKVSTLVLGAISAALLLPWTSPAGARPSSPAQKTKAPTRTGEDLPSDRGFMLLAQAETAENLPSSPSGLRARDLGIQVGSLEPGPLNAITDVKGVAVGHKTIWQGEDVRTGVTVIVPQPGNVFQNKLPAAIVVGNGFGKLVGLTQVKELGVIETPIALTNTLSVFTAATAVIKHTLGQAGNEDVRSVNPVAGECNDGWLNDIRGFHVAEKDVLEAIESAKAGPVEEGSVGAGTGTMCLGFKGGIGTSSRLVEIAGRSYTVGVLVQTNYGGSLRMAGVPVGELLGAGASKGGSHGSCMIVLATDAPLSSRSLGRLAGRTFLGLARTGSVMSHGSGDYAIAFSTAYTIPYEDQEATFAVDLLRDDRMTALFAAAVDAAEEAVYNSLLTARSVTGRDGHTAQRLPVEPTERLLRDRGVLD